MPRFIAIPMFAVSAVFAAIGLWMIWQGAPAGWPVFLFFGAGALLGAAVLMPSLSGFGQSDGRSVEAILARFPEPLSFRPSRRKWLLLSICSAAVAGASVFDALVGHKPGSSFMGWFGFALFGFAAAGSVAALLPGAIVLKLDDDGFDVTRLFFRRRRARWADAKGFQVVTIGRNNMVVYDWVKKSDSWVNDANRFVAGRNTNLPDNFGFSPENLAALMNQWRERALARRDITSPS